MRQRTMWLSGAGMGAATALLFDPISGTRRRHQIADAFAHLRRQTARAASTTRRDLSNRALGVVAATRQRARGGAPDNAVLEERVHSALGRLVSRPHLISVTARAGYVTLDGPIVHGDRDRICHAVRGVPGVCDVEVVSTPHIEPAHDRASDSFVEWRHHPQSDLFQRSWAPGTRAIVGGAGMVLLTVGCMRRDRTGFGLSLAGAALALRAGLSGRPRGHGGRDH